ncbi:interleukin-15 receptor subunit alpha isoform X28 [Homo sapiens]|uniref:interleukin-15 receptor subunit alpha isoform X28 n=1 Tax=Homo sapiens TaxID=9606 RepID=UPI0023DF1073|nr:interleukin-15 receptor subunit alpha isoform X28 [Homo sapiens]
MTEAWRCLVLSNVTARPENLHLGAYRPGSQASLETPRKKKTHQPKRRMAAWKNLRKRGSEWGHRTECTLEVPEHDERGGPGGSRACVEPAASSPSSNNTAATTAAIVPGSQLMPSKSPSTGTTEISSHESSHGTPSQTTAKTWELTASASHQPPGVYPQGHSDTTVAISTSTVLLCGLSAVSLLACYLKSRASVCSCHPRSAGHTCSVGSVC